MTTANDEELPRPTVVHIGWRQMFRWIVPLYRDTLKALTDMSETLGDVLFFDLTGFDKVVVVSNPQVLEFVLRTEPDKFGKTRALKQLELLLGNGIFFAEGAEWERQHKLLKPAFAESQLRSYETIVAEEIDLLVERWTKICDSAGTIDLQKESIEFMFRLMNRSLFHQRTSMDFKSVIRHLQIVIADASLVRQSVKALYLFTAKAFGLTYDVKKRIRTHMVPIDRTVADLIALGKKDREHCGYLLELLLSALDRGEISEQLVQDEIKNFFLAGLDTTAQGMIWGLAVMATHPAEAKRISSSINTQGAYEHTTWSSNKTVFAFIDELFRMYPPVWGTPRFVKEDVPNTDIPFSKDTYVYLNFYSLHHSTRYWTSPAVFNTARFLENSRSEMMQTYLPFGSGKRTCIGKRFALMQLAIVLPVLAHHFTFELVSGGMPKILPNVVIAPASKVLITLKKRTV